MERNGRKIEKFVFKEFGNFNFLKKEHSESGQVKVDICSEKYLNQKKKKKIGILGQVEPV